MLNYYIEKKDTGEKKFYLGISDEWTTTIENSKKYQFIPKLINSNSELEQFILQHNPQIIVYNYHQTTMPWINDQTIRNKYNNIHHVMIHYDITQDLVNNFNPNTNTIFKFELFLFSHITRKYNCL